MKGFLFWLVFLFPLKIGAIDITQVTNDSALDAQHTTDIADRVKKASDTMTGNLTMDGGIFQLDIELNNPSHKEGQLFYDKSDKALAYHNDEADVTMQVGQEMWVRVRNNSGATILNGKAVYVTGALAGTPTIALAKADSDITAQVAGLATHDIENNTNGYVTVFGLVRGIDTSAFSEGDSLHLSSVTAGELVAVHLIGSGFDVMVGKVTVDNPFNGVIFVVPRQHSTVGLGAANQIRAMNGAADAEAFKTLLVDPELTLSQSDTSISVGVDSSSVTLLGPSPDHTLLSNVTASQHHTKTTDASELSAGILSNARLSQDGVTLDTMTITGNAFSVGSSTLVVTGGRVGIGLTPTVNMLGLSIEAGLVTIKETTTPTADTDFGKVYTKSDNQLYFQDGAGTEHIIMTGAAGIKHEFHVPFQDPTGQVGNWDVVTINASQHAHFTFQVPHDFESLSDANVIMIPDATETIQWDVLVSVSSATTSHDDDERSTLNETLAVIIDVLTEVDVSSSLTGLSAGDYVAVDYQSDTASLRIIGFEFDYN